MALTTVSSTNGTAIIWNDRIKFGDNILVFWETMIMDEDIHNTD